MEIKPEHLEQLEKEVQHIFDSGANEVRVYNMIQAFIEKQGVALFINDVVNCKHEDYTPCYGREGEFMFKQCDTCGEEFE